MLDDGYSDQSEYPPAEDGPQALQMGDAFGKPAVRLVMESPSKVMIFPVRRLPAPVKYFSTSAAWMLPMIPQTGPTTPTWLLTGTVPASGASSKMHR